MYTFIYQHLYTNGFFNASLTKYVIKQIKVLLENKNILSLNTRLKANKRFIIKYNNTHIPIRPILYSIYYTCNVFHVEGKTK